MSTRQDPNRPDSDLRSEIEAELEAHLELFVEEQTKLGIDPSEARAEAEERFGDRYQITHACIRATKGDFPMNRHLLIGLGAFVLVALAFFLTQFQIRQLQSRQLQSRGAQATQPFFGPIAPIPPDQVIVHVGGTLTIVRRSGAPNDFCGEYLVQRDGMILLPEIGWFLVAGKSRPKIEEEINKLAALYYPNPDTLDVMVSNPRFQSGFASALSGG